VSRTFDFFNHKVSAVPGAGLVGHEQAARPKSNGHRRVASNEELIRDEVRKLVHRMFVLSRPTEAPGAVAFSGVEESAGCGWVCARVAEALAEQGGETVCAVDANVRAPSLHKHLGCENGFGFVDAINHACNITELAKRVRDGNLWLVAAGSPAGPEDGLVNPRRLQDCMQELTSEFDRVLVVTPPLDEGADAALIAQATDGVVLVVGSGTTRRAAARIAKQSLDAARVPMLGAVLNRREFPIPASLYWKL
jgi:polysaccharide biosynthesis transport protein